MHGLEWCIRAHLRQCARLSAPCQGHVVHKHRQHRGRHLLGIVVGVLLTGLTNVSREPRRFRPNFGHNEPKIYSLVPDEGARTMRSGADDAQDT